MFFPKPPKLLFIQPTFPPQNNSKPSPRIFRYIRYRQNFAHILNYLFSKPLFRNILFNKTSNPTPGGNSQNIHLPRQTHTHTKYLPLSCSAPMVRSFETIPLTRPEKVRGIHPCPRMYSVSTNPHKTWYASTSTQNIDSILGRPHKTLPTSTTFTNIETRPKVLTTDMHKSG